MSLKYSFVLNTVHYAVYNLRVDRKIVLSIALVLFLLNVKNTDHWVQCITIPSWSKVYCFDSTRYIHIKRENTDHFSTVYYFSELIESLPFR